MINRVVSSMAVSFAMSFAACGQNTNISQSSEVATAPMVAPDSRPILRQCQTSPTTFGGVVVTVREAKARDRQSGKYEITIRKFAGAELNEQEPIEWPGLENDPIEWPGLESEVVEWPGLDAEGIKTVLADGRLHSDGSARLIISQDGAFSIDRLENGFLKGSLFTYLFSDDGDNFDDLDCNPRVAD